MIAGAITAEGIPVIILAVAGGYWPAIIGTGFNGDLELPIRLQSLLNSRFLCRNRSALAAGQIIEEDTYLVDFPFDGETRSVEATFVHGGEILIGTHLLSHYRLEIDFYSRTLQLQRVSVGE